MNSENEERKIKCKFLFDHIHEVLKEYNFISIMDMVRKKNFIDGFTFLFC